jgi:hypothetical protein
MLIISSGFRADAYGGCATEDREDNMRVGVNEVCVNVAFHSAFDTHQTTESKRKTRKQKEKTRETHLLCHNDVKVDIGVNEVCVNIAFHSAFDTHQTMLRRRLADCIFTKFQREIVFRTSLFRALFVRLQPNDVLTPPEAPFSQQLAALHRRE